jgi:hypothetical protein
MEWIRLHCNIMPLYFLVKTFAVVPEHHPAWPNQHGGGDRHLRHQVPGQARQARPRD